MRQLKNVAIALVASAVFGCTGQGINTADVFKAQSGTVDLTVQTENPNAYTSVEFEVDNQLLGKDSDVSDGWSYKLDSSTLSNGIHTVRALGNTPDGAQVELLNNTLLIQNEGAPAPSPSPSASPAAAGTVPAADEPAAADDEGAAAL